MNSHNWRTDWDYSRGPGRRRAWQCAWSDSSSSIKSNSLISAGYAYNHRSNHHDQGNSSKMTHLFKSKKKVIAKRITEIYRKLILANMEDNFNHVLNAFVNWRLVQDRSQTVKDRWNSVKSWVCHHFYHHSLYPRIRGALSSQKKQLRSLE